MSQPEFFIGIDVAAKSFTASVYFTNHDVVFLGEFKNQKRGFKSFLKSLKRQTVSSKNLIICMEATGVYCMALCIFLYEAGYPLSVEHAMRIKRSFKQSEHKTDKIDSKQIAEYAYRYVDKLPLWAPKPKDVLIMQQTVTLREQLVKQQTAIKNSLKVSKKNTTADLDIIETQEALLKTFKESIKKLEKKMEAILQSVSKYRLTTTHLRGVPGVGLLLTCKLFILTEGFRLVLNHRELASYCGICPYRHESGTSIKKPSRSRQCGPSGMRQLLHLAANTMMIYEDKWKFYKATQEAKGKHFLVINNNVRNKLLKIICAIMNSGKPYSANFVSAHPNFSSKPVI